MAKQEKGEILNEVQDFFNFDLDYSRKMRERIWFRNIMYYMGEQWISWDKDQHMFVQKIHRKNIPTPVSNIIRQYVVDMMALILNKDYDMSIWPNSNEQSDREASLLGKRLLENMDMAHDEAFLDEIEMVALWAVTVGVGFNRTTPDMSSGQWIYDSKGNRINTGDVRDRHVIPFNVVLDDLGSRLEDKSKIGIKSLQSREWVEDTFKVKIPTESIERENYERRLMKMVSSVSPWKGDGLFEPTSPSAGLKDAVIFYEMEFAPTKDCPEGRHLAVCGDQLCFDYKKMPIPAEKEGKWYYSLTDFHYRLNHGSFWSSGGVDDLISPQNTINQIDQDLEINRKSLGRPWVLMPLGTVIKRMTQYARKLMALMWDPKRTGNMPPEIIPGTPYPAQILNERENHRKVAQDSAGNPSQVLSGNAPTAKASGIMVDILRDAAEQGHAPDTARFYRSKKRVYKKRLILAQELYSEERLLKIGGKGKDIEVISFRGSDLRGNHDVRLELSSGLASTASGRTNLILELMKGGIFDPRNPIEPETRQEIFRRLGLSGFVDKNNIHVERAKRENAMLSTAETKDLEMVPYLANIETGEQGEAAVLPGLFVTALVIGPQGEPLPMPLVLDEPLFKYDNHPIHIETHKSFMLSPEFQALHPAIQAIAIAHLEAHEEQMREEMAKRVSEQVGFQNQAQQEALPPPEEGPQIEMNTEGQLPV